MRRCSSPVLESVADLLFVIDIKHLSLLWTNPFGKASSDINTWSSKPTRIPTKSMSISTRKPSRRSMVTICNLS